MTKSRLRKAYEQNRESVNITVAVILLILFAFISVAKAEGLQTVTCYVKGKPVYTGTYTEKDYKIGSGYFKGTDWNYKCEDGVCGRDAKPFEIVEIYNNDMVCRAEPKK